MRTYILKSKTQKEREKIFWKKVEKTDSCWLWRGGTSQGYGVFSIKLDKGYRLHKAHRIAWELIKGPIPKDRIICHKCNIRNCVNPDHLYIGTHGDNNVDTFNAGRCGSGRPSKFEDGELWLMQQMRDKVPAKIIARCFKTTILTIYRNTTSAKMIFFNKHKKSYK